MSATPGAAIVAASPAGLAGRVDLGDPVGLVEHALGGRRGATVPAERNEARRPEMRPLAVTHRVPPCRGSHARAAARAAVLTATGLLIIPALIAEPPGAVVRHPREAHPLPPGELRPARPQRQTFRKRWWQCSDLLSTTPALSSQVSRLYTNILALPAESVAGGIMPFSDT